MSSWGISRHLGPVTATWLLPSPGLEAKRPCGQCGAPFNPDLLGVVMIGNIHRQEMETWPLSLSCPDGPLSLTFRMHCKGIVVYPAVGLEFHFTCSQWNSLDINQIQRHKMEKIKRDSPWRGPERTAGPAFCPEPLGSTQLRQQGRGDTNNYGSRALGTDSWDIAYFRHEHPGVGVGSPTMSLILQIKKLRSRESQPLACVTQPGRGRAGALPHA